MSEQEKSQENVEKEVIEKPIEDPGIKVLAKKERQRRYAARVYKEKSDKKRLLLEEGLRLLNEKNDSELTDKIVNRVLLKMNSSFKPPEPSASPKKKIEVHEKEKNTEIQNPKEDDHDESSDEEEIQKMIQPAKSTFVPVQNKRKIQYQEMDDFQRRPKVSHGWI